MDAKLKNDAIRYLSVKGLHGRQDLEVHFNPTLNIIHGRNGAGKTTILHILANLSEGSVGLFTHLRFKEIILETFTDNVIQINRINQGSDKQHIAVTVNGKILPAVHFSQGESKHDLLHYNELASIFLGEAVYLPAFRAILDATRLEKRRAYPPSYRDDSDKFQLMVQRERELISGHHSKEPAINRYSRDRIESTVQKTIMCRNWFGEFVPTIRYPSLQEVFYELISEYEEAVIKLSNYDRETMSTIVDEILEAIVDEQSISKDPMEQLVKKIESHLSQIDTLNYESQRRYEKILTFKSYESSRESEKISALHNIFAIYARALDQRLEEEYRVFSDINLFVDSVNRFLVDKKLKFPQGHLQRRTVSKRHLVHFEDGNSAGFGVLSSGERHVITLLFSSTHMARYQGIVLLDEPELSMHVDWQRHILTEIIKQAGERQVIACTHSPEVAGEHRDCLIELKVTPTVCKDNDLVFDDSETFEEGN